ncbi:cript family protein [Pyricularia oryzae Y34]|uniref:Cript family protein n=2 Tax=Pyricularia oryzae TaxID=318829 RepID=A0AA97NZ27_PYRO3|nr:cript family protein [Pyricularia oryzae Y34]
MVCGKCQKLSKGTSLATPSVKKKSEMYYGSPASSSASKSSATLGQTGVSKGHKYCHSCAYKADACAMCGKSNSKSKTGSVPVVTGQKFSSK